MYPLHVEAGAKIVPFAGYEMPVQYPAGIIKEHLHTREKAGLFDVSHMGQISVRGENAALLLESLIPVDIVNLQPGKQKYGLFLNENGGIMDDLMIARISENEFSLVVNAACKNNDLTHLNSKIGEKLEINMSTDRSLVALQGPESASVMKRLGHDLSNMAFMDICTLDIMGINCSITRSGYTGEDGFEISVRDNDASDLANLLIDNNDVEWVGLGARDSLRLEAGLCLYGHDLNEQTTPLEANLLWAISKARRPGGERSGGFPGDHLVMPQIPRNVGTLLVGLQPEGKAPIREGAIIEDSLGKQIGHVTSGSFSPSLGQPICIGYVSIDSSKPETRLNAVVRNKRLPVVVTRLPFVPRNYYRKT